jgi:hypothetical protein
MNDTNCKIASIYLPKKNYTLENAKSFLKHYGYKINNVDDENNYFKFRQLSSKTLKKYGYIDYRSKQLGKSGILLIIAYKDLDEEDDIRGGDFYNYPINYIGDRYNQAKDFLINGSRSFSTKVKNILAKIGNDRIYTITIFRYAINSIIKNILELTSLKSIPYDNLFHLGLIFNNQVLLEKNSIINMEINPRLPKETEFINMSFNQSININQFINNGLQFMGQDKFFTYQSTSNNCQDFALNLLYANGIDDDSLNTFIKQDVSSIFANNAYLRRFVNNITDTDGRLKYMQGGKIRKNVRFR